MSELAGRIVIRRFGHRDGGQRRSLSSQRERCCARRDRALRCYGGLQSYELRVDLRPTGNARMPPMHDLPVVPKCRTPLALPRRANHDDALGDPASARGTLRPIVTKREAGMRWTRQRRRERSHRRAGESS
jgi:hypothetical protein